MDGTKWDKTNQMAKCFASLYTIRATSGKKANCCVVLEVKSNSTTLRFQEPMEFSASFLVERN